MNFKIWKQKTLKKVKTLKTVKQENEAITPEIKRCDKQENLISKVETVKQEIEDFDRRAKIKFEELEKKLQSFADKMKAITPEIKRCDKQECNCCMNEIPKEEFYTTCCSYKACLKCLLQNGKDECPQCKSKIRKQLPDILKFAFRMIVKQKKQIQEYENMENLRSSIHSLDRISDFLR